MVLRIDRQYVPCCHFRVRQFTDCPLPLAGRNQAGVIIAGMRAGSMPKHERREEEERQPVAKNSSHPPEGMPSRSFRQPRRWFVHPGRASTSTAGARQRGRGLSGRGRAHVGQAPSRPARDLEQGPPTLPGWLSPVIGSRCASRSCLCPVTGNALPGEDSGKAAGTPQPSLDMAKKPASPIAEAVMAALNTTSAYRDRARTDRDKIHARRKFVRRS